MLYPPHTLSSHVHKGHTRGIDSPATMETPVYPALAVARNPPSVRFRPLTHMAAMFGAVALLLGAAAHAAPPTRQINISTFDNADALAIPMERVMVAAYARLGIQASVSRRPIARSLLDADAGVADAELG